MAFEIEFYKTKDGKEPVVDFLDSLDDKMAAKLVGLMEVLEEKGTELRMPYSEYLDDGIFELRCKQGSNITRVLYFFLHRKKDYCYKWICEENTEDTTKGTKTSKGKTG